MSPGTSPSIPPPTATQLRAGVMVAAVRGKCDRIGKVMIAKLL